MSAMTGATVDITFGTGSFGSTMNTHLPKQGVESVHLLSGDETKHDETRNRFGDSRLRFFLGDVRDFLGDVRDRESVADAFVYTDFVYTPAARKQVPSCKFFPEQAVRTNVVPSHNVVEVAAAGVRSVLCLGTDKAVYPVNVMGMTKALNEKMHETLLSREGMVKAVDQADYCRVQPRPRGLARQLRVEEGESEMVEHDEYAFANTSFNVAQTQVLLFDLPEIHQLLEV